ncbi:hypothetical protein ABY42_18840 (plasmid) [Haloferax gibbonsii]|uniref:Uncharacterized protein n=1 Tax=Haloferax gibbonsii TaxID=35746 RepID=A0A0K1IZH0_HALGI|nr:hypothetical protein ABY42_18840 [Haloferax gibbonsii]
MCLVAAFITWANHDAVGTPLDVGGMCLTRFGVFVSKVVQEVVERGVLRDGRINLVVVVVHCRRERLVLMKVVLPVIETGSLTGGFN